jgi:hypothetical protein
VRLECSHPILVHPGFQTDPGLQLSSITMSYSDQFAQNGVVSHTEAGSAEIGHSPDVMNQSPNLETLVPKNVSGNKRAVIEKLIARYRVEAAS